MNLVMDCMQVFTSRPLSHFKQGEKTLWFRRFDNALRNPALKNYRRELQSIYEHVRAHNEARQLWKDCEIYYPIDYLSRATDESYFPYMLEMLRILLGLSDIRKSASKLPDGYYRLKHLCGKIFHVASGRLSILPKHLIWKPRGFSSDFYLPKDGLFSDIMNEKLYPEMNKPYDGEPLKVGIQKALGHMREFSEDIYQDFQDSVSNVVLLTKTPRLGTSSLTMRYKYFGGIFINPFMNDEYKAVEALVHEYIHNRCWLWWEMYPPTGVPSENVKIVSPVTGNKVRVSAMIQAYIIYVNALQFYRFMQARVEGCSSGAILRMNRRAALIARGLPVLHKRLRRKVVGGTDTARLFDYLREVSRPYESYRV